MPPAFRCVDILPRALEVGLLALGNPSSPGACHLPVHKAVAEGRLPPVGQPQTRDRGGQRPPGLSLIPERRGLGRHFHSLPCSQVELLLSQKEQGPSELALRGWPGLLDFAVTLSGRPGLRGSWAPVLGPGEEEAKEGGQGAFRGLGQAKELRQLPLLLPLAP